MSAVSSRPSCGYGYQMVPTHAERAATLQKTTSYNYSKKQKVLEMFWLNLVQAPAASLRNQRTPAPVVESPLHLVPRLPSPPRRAVSTPDISDSGYASSSGSTSSISTIPISARSRSSVASTPSSHQSSVLDLRAPGPAQIPSERAVTTPQTQITQSPRQQPQPTLNLSPCRTRHVPRRTLDEDCSICSEPLVNVPLAEVTWCKSTCGHNFHAACMERWLEIGRTCVTWYVSTRVPQTYFPLVDIFSLRSRGRWQLSCEHDTNSPRFSSWTEEDMGLVKLFDLMSMLMERMDAWL
jgi:hypothetical protein